MRLHIDKIGPEGYDLDEPVTIAWVTEALGPGSPFRCEADGRLEAHLDRVEDAVHVRGRAALQLSASCGRCLGPVSLALDTPIEVTLFPEGTEPQAGPDGELAAEDMGVSTYAGEEIDLSGIVHDEVFLELPMIPICSQSCAGLCPTCGKNLNEGSCGCEPQMDNRWEALRRIKLG